MAAFISPVPMSYSTTRYRAENAFWMAKLSQLAYEQQKDTQDRHPDDEGILEQLQALDPQFEAVHGYEAKSSQAILVKHQHYIVAAFRGTDELADWFDNVNALSTDGPFGRVHRGFQAALLDVWPAMRDQYREYRRPSRETAARATSRPQLPLWITGHSLGGALATLAAAQLIQADEPFYGAYTFGSPRVGDRDFARIFNVEAGRRLFRFQNNNDIVTRVPARVMGYSHVGTFVYISEKGEISNDPGWWYRFLDQVTGAVSDLGDIGIDGVTDHDVANYLHAIQEWGEKPIAGLLP